MMQQEQMNSKKKKLVFLLLLMTVPTAILTYLFLNLGSKKEEPPAKVSINTKLPSSPLDKQSPLDKLSVYIQADQDSVKRAEQISRDPYYQQLEKGNTLDTDNSFNPFNVNKEIKKPLFQRQSSADLNELKVKQKISELERQLNTNTDLPIKKEKEIQKNSTLSSFQKAPAEDPEIEQLNSMLEKVLDIQHPQRVQEKMEASSTKEQEKIMKVQNKLEECLDDCIMPGNGKPDYTGIANRFYESGELQTIPEDNAISANIHQTETVIPGSTIKLRLNQDMYINSALIPKGTFVFGISSLQGDRLKVIVNNITYRNSIYPVELSVYSLDGMEGILIPGAITRDVAKQSAGQTVSSIQMSSLDPSLKAQATTAGVEAVKNLLTRKVKVVQVTVKAGAVLLRSSR